MTMMKADDKIMSGDVSVGEKPKAPHAFKSRKATHKGEAITIIRAPNEHDGEFDPKIAHFLIRNAAGEYKIVPVSEIEKSKAAE